MRLQYILDPTGQTPIPAKSIIEWAKFFDNKDRRIVRQEQVGNYWISTVFLGLDHSFKMEGPPVLWETMVFGPEKDSPGVESAGIKPFKFRPDFDQTRCSGNREQAEAMHERMVAKWRGKE